MSDVVEGLRSGELCGEDRCRVMDAEGGCVCAVAAAEIEALRAHAEQLSSDYDLIAVRNAGLRADNKRLRAENERLRKLDAAAAQVAAVILMQSPRFTGGKPYAGWDSLASALREDYAELRVLRGENSDEAV